MDLGLSVDMGDPDTTAVGRARAEGDQPFEPRVFLYDNYPGGIGLSAPLFEMRDVLASKGMRFGHAGTIVEGREDSYEPDGIINARHQYLGSYRSKIHYYLGQTSWAVGDYQATLDGMTRAAAEPLVQHDDRRVATGFWQYLALRKLGRHDEAQAVVDAIPEDLELVENFDYYDGIRFFKGTLGEASILEDGGLNATFGVAMLHLIEGRAERAAEMLTDLVAGSAQGYWPAETELLQLRQ